MDADFSAVFNSFSQANTMFQNFATNIRNVANSIPDFGKRFNFTSNGASQAAQDSREAANAARLLAAADLDRARAADIANRASQRQSQTNRSTRDEYGQLVAQSQALVRAYYNEAAAQLKVGNASEAAKAQLEQMRLEALKGQQQLQQIEQGVGRYQRNIGNYASGTAALSQQLKQITTEIPNFFISARIGFQSLSNNLPGIFNELTRLREANVALAASGQPTVSVFKQFLGAFNPLNIAIGVGVGLLTAYGPAIIDWAKGLSLGSDAARLAAKYQLEYQKATKEATEAATKAAITEQTNADVLYAATQNVSLSYKERKMAADELIKIAPRIFEGLTNEAIVAGNAANAYRKLTDAIKDKIAVAVNEKQAESILSEVVAAKDIVDKNKELAAIKTKLVTLDKQSVDLAAQKQNYDPFKHSTEESTAFLLDNAKKAKALRDEYNATYESAKKLSGGNDFTGADLPSVDKQISDLKEYYDALGKYQSKVIDISALRGKVDALFAPLDKPERVKHVHDYTNELENMRLKITALGRKGNVEDDSASWIPNTDKMKTEADKAGDILKDYVNSRKNAEAEALGAMLDARQKEANAWQERINKTKEALDTLKGNIKVALSDAATIVGEGIGNIISGTGGIGNLFGNLLTLLGAQLESFGKYLIEISATMVAAQKALAALASVPGLGIVAGVGLIALGQILKNAGQNSSKGVGKVKMASGALAYGPTSALVGEYATARTNPEVIAPLDKLKTILKNSNTGNGGNQVMIPDVRIQGQDLLLVFKRADKSFRR